MWLTCRKRKDDALSHCGRSFDALAGETNRAMVPGSTGEETTWPRLSGRPLIRQFGLSTPSTQWLSFGKQGPLTNKSGCPIFRADGRCSDRVVLIDCGDSLVERRHEWDLAAGARNHFVATRMHLDECSPWAEWRDTFVEWRGVRRDPARISYARRSSKIKQEN